jgi:putative MATE family efflux protein
MGLSVGAGVCVAHGIGAKKYDDVKKTVHTAVATALLMGVFVAAIGFFLAPKILVIMGTHEGPIMEKATIYVKIFFLGAPFSMLYNYCASMLRASGDSKRPLIFLAISGVLKLALNLLLVAVFKMGVAGVAIATIPAHILSCIMILGYMMKTDGCLHFSFKEMKIHADKLKKILIIGVPSGVQRSLFSLANVVIQSSINGLGEDAIVTGSAASQNIESLVYVVYNAFYEAALTFTGQAVGAKKYKNIKKILLCALACIMIVVAVLTPFLIIFKDAFLSVYLRDATDALGAGSVRYMLLVLTYFLCGVMEVGSAGLRGMGRSTTSMIISLIGSCLLRIVWVKTVCVLVPQAWCIYLCMPISWILTSAVLFIFVAVIVRKTIKNEERHELNKEMLV